jgi:hypothetical protein
MQAQLHHVGQGVVMQSPKVDPGPWVMDRVHLQQQHALDTTQRGSLKNDVQMGHRRGAVPLYREEHFRLARSNGGTYGQGHEDLKLVRGRDMDVASTIISLVQKIQVARSVQEGELQVDRLEIRLCQPLRLSQLGGQVSRLQIQKPRRYKVIVFGLRGRSPCQFGSVTKA